MDSGATSHVIGNSINLQEIHPATSTQGIMTAGGETHLVQGTGSSNVHTPAGSIKLTNVKYVPSLKKSLVSVGTIADTGSKVIFLAAHCWVTNPTDHKKIIAIGNRDPRNGLYSLSTVQHASLVKKIDVQSLWHKRYGHLSFPGLQHLSHHGRVIGLPQIDSHHAACKNYLSGRQSKRPFPHHFQNRASETAKLIHLDLVGPMPQTSLGGSKYILVLTDDYSRKSWCYFLKSKDQTFGYFKYFKELIEFETRHKLRNLRTDRGGEFMSHEFLAYCQHNGIKRQLSQAKTPQQNGVAERQNQTIIEHARSMAVEAHLPSYLWTEAVNTANYIVNLSPTSANLGVTLEEKYSGKLPTVTHLKIFGSIAYVHIPKTDRKKLDTKTRKCIFVGYDIESKIYRLFNPIQKKIELTRDVTVDETKIGFHYLSEKAPEPVTFLP